MDAYYINQKEMWLCAQLVCYPGIQERIRDNGTNRETTGGGPGAKRADKRRMDEL